MSFGEMIRFTAKVLGHFKNIYPVEKKMLKKLSGFDGRASWVVSVLLGGHRTPHSGVSCLYSCKVKDTWLAYVLNRGTNLNMQVLDEDIQITWTFLRLVPK